MEPVVRLPLPGRTLVEIRRSRAVVIAAGESCFLYGLFLQLLCSAQSVPGWRSRQRRHLGNVGGRNVTRWKGLTSMHYTLSPHFDSIPFSMTPVNFSPCKYILRHIRTRIRTRT